MRLKLKLNRMRPFQKSTKKTCMKFRCQDERIDSSQNLNAKVVHVISISISFNFDKVLDSQRLIEMILTLTLTLTLIFRFQRLIEMITDRYRQE